MSTTELEGPRPAARPDDERARAFGAEFRLGPLQSVSRGREIHSHVTLGLVLGSVVALVGVPSAIGVAFGPYPMTGKAITWAVIALLFGGCCWLFGAGWSRSRVSSRLYRYSDGLVQLVGDEPEPRVARWADVRDITVDYHRPEDLPLRLNGFTLTTRSGTELPGISGQTHRGEMRALLADAWPHLAPRLIPAMTERYEAGAPVAYGPVQVSQRGIMLSQWWPSDELVPWSQVKSVHMTYIDPKDGDYVDEIIIGRAGQPDDEPTVEIPLVLLPNGIFLPALLSHAARRHGVMVTGYHGDGGAITGA